MTMTTALAQTEPQAINLREELLNLQITKEDDATYIVKCGSFKVALKYGHHWGPPFPGSDKDTLLQPGAQVLNKLLGVFARPVSPETVRVMEWERGFFHYEHTVELVNIATGRVEAVGVGSCNSHEAKYRYRNANRVCPKCKQEAIFQSKDRPEWYCWSKKGGCGAKFGIGDPAIAAQKVGKVVNENPADQLRTFQAMSIKRAHVSATAAHTCCSDIWGADGDRTVEFDTYEDAEFKEPGEERADSPPLPSTPQPTPAPKVPEQRNDPVPPPSAPANFGLVPGRAKLKNLILEAQKAAPGTSRDDHVCKALGRSNATWTDLELIQTEEELRRAIAAMESR